MVGVGLFDVREDFRRVLLAHRGLSVGEQHEDASEGILEWRRQCRPKRSVDVGHAVGIQALDEGSGLGLGGRGHRLGLVEQRIDQVVEGHDVEAILRVQVVHEEDTGIPGLRDLVAGHAPRSVEHELEVLGNRRRLVDIVLRLHDQHEESVFAAALVAGQQIHVQLLVLGDAVGEVEVRRSDGSSLEPELQVIRSLLLDGGVLGEAGGGVAGDGTDGGDVDERGECLPNTPLGVDVVGEGIAVLHAPELVGKDLDVLQANVERAVRRLRRKIDDERIGAQPLTEIGVHRSATRPLGHVVGSRGVVPRDHRRLPFPVVVHGEADHARALRHREQEPGPGAALGERELRRGRRHLLHDLDIDARPRRSRRSARIEPQSVRASCRAVREHCRGETAQRRNSMEPGHVAPALSCAERSHGPRPHRSGRLRRRPRVPLSNRGATARRVPGKPRISPRSALARPAPATPGRAAHAMHDRAPCCEPSTTTSCPV